MIRLTLGTTSQWGGKLRELSVQHNRDDILIVDWAGTEVVSGGQKLGSVLGDSCRPTVSALARLGAPFASGMQDARGEGEEVPEVGRQ